MRLDHVAYRVKSRATAVKFFEDAFGYTVQSEFKIKLEDGSETMCTALEPPEKRAMAPFVVRPGLLLSVACAPQFHALERNVSASLFGRILGYGKKFWSFSKRILERIFKIVSWYPVEYHMAPEIFVSEGPPGSLIYNWVEKNCPGRNGGIHHLAYEVDDVRSTMSEWQQKGFLFTTDDILSCDDLDQVFTEPNPHTGIIYEFIERKGAHGFCQGNVSRLMNSTAHLS